MTPDGDDRNSEIWALAQQGIPHAAIAERFGISRQRVGQLLSDMTPAAWGFTDRDRAQIRAKETAVLESMAGKIEAVIDSPPLQHSAIGKPIEDPLHPGRYLINETVRVAAIRERRLLSESFRRLTGADLSAADRSTFHDEASRAALADIERRREEAAQAVAAIARYEAIRDNNDVVEAEIVS